jgi:iron complex transport system ATP-binding protein
MLEVSNLSLSFDDKKILNEINFSLKSNEMLTILGPNGSGKSTLIKSLCGIYRNFTGSIKVSNEDSNNLSQKELSRFVSYVPQFLDIHANYSVWDFMEMSYFPHLDNFRGLTIDEIEKGESILERFRLIKLKDRYMNTLSGGERQKVFISSSIFQNPQLLLLDEPTSYLDPKHQDEVNEIIFSLNEEMAVILVSHDINSSIINSRRVIGLKSGEIFFDGGPKDVLHKNLLNELYDKNFKYMNHPNKDIEFIIPKVFND